MKLDWWPCQVRVRWPTTYLVSLITQYLDVRSTRLKLCKIIVFCSMTMSNWQGSNILSHAWWLSKGPYLDDIYMGNADIIREVDGHSTINLAKCRQGGGDPKSQTFCSHHLSMAYFPSISSWASIIQVLCNDMCGTSCMANTNNSEDRLYWPKY